MNILITSIGRRSYMVKYFQKALRSSGGGEVHAANSQFSYAMQVADKSVVTPLISDPSYIDFLLKYSVHNQISAIVPLFDIDLTILAKNKAVFKNKGIEIIVSDYGIVQLCNDKWNTYEMLRSIGIPTPTSCLSIQQAKEKIRSGELIYPLMIKPRWGMGSVGIFQADNEHELEILFEKSQNLILNSNINSHSENEPNKKVLIQQKIDGEEYGLDILNDFQGRMLSFVSKRKLLMRFGETDSAEIIDDPKLHELANKISQNLHFIANLDVDCIKKGGNYSVLEFNCRFGGQYPFSHLSGVDYPKAIVQMIIGEPVERRILRPKVGIVGTKDITPRKLKAI